MKPGQEKENMRGTVTAELAVVLPAVTLLLAVLLLSVAVGLLQLRLEEGARAGARALARGDSSEQVMDIISRVSGRNVAVSIGASEGFATVAVEGRVGGVLSGLVPWAQTAKASAKLENPAAAAAAGYSDSVSSCGSEAATARDHGPG